MRENLTEVVRRQTDSECSRAIAHRFVEELHGGAGPQKVMASCWMRDDRLRDGFVALLGAAMASADTLVARVRPGRFAGAVSSEEDDYFARAFAALGIDANARQAAPEAIPAWNFKALMRAAATPEIKAHGAHHKQPTTEIPPHERIRSGASH